MSKVWWKMLGDGNCHLVMIHGWGLNSKIWNCINKKLISRFTLHLVDLPGFGYSRSFGAMHIKDMAEHVLQNSPKKAIWLGWSLGGLVASQIALMYPKHVKALITVTSSPCFIARKKWPGIQLDILTSFQKKLGEDLQRTVKRFLALQTLGTETVREDSRMIKNTMLEFSIPDIEVLNGGLEMLKSIDLREPLTNLLLPHLRIYGYLDKLVPHRISTILDTYWPKSKSLIIKKAAHVPFISHSKEFCNAIITLSHKLY